MMGKNSKSNEESTQDTPVAQPTATTNESTQQEVKTTSERPNKCPDCEGRGIRNPDIDHQVCQTCEGTGKA